jgi:hypothetical protein
MRPATPNRETQTASNFPSFQTELRSSYMNVLYQETDKYDIDSGYS